MNPHLYVALWVLTSVAVGLCVGWYLGHSTHENRERVVAQRERQDTLRALVDLLESARQLGVDVDHHNVEIARVGQCVEELHVTGDLENVQQALLGQIASVLQSNKKLEADLQYTQFRMEEQAQEIDRTRLEARTDALSGVANRKGFDEKLQFLLSQWKRNSTPFALILADVDNFKRINDTYGHPAGDRLIEQIAKFLRTSVRPADFVARYGGDEFAMLLPQTDLERGQQIAQRICQAAGRTDFDLGVGQEQVLATLSMGVSAPRDADGPSNILARADEGLYKSKHAGRNQVQTVSTGELLESPV